MADGTIELKLSAPEREKVELEATEVTIPGTDGVFSVLPHHTPLLTTLVPGIVVAYDREGKEHYFAVAGGFADVKDNCISILTGAFEPGSEIDLARAEASLAKAESLLRKRDEEVDVVRTELRVTRALARIGAHQREPYGGGVR